MDLTLFRHLLDRACWQARSEYRLQPSEDALNMALAKLRGILNGCIVSARAMEGESGSQEMMAIARDVVELHQQELVREG
ncbi:MAG: hypothetical protein IH614_07590 [Desulfuromonadales bacterium]|nr:hypothetical protein [Desulfuromonadales bacterium]